MYRATRRVRAIIALHPAPSRASDPARLTSSENGVNSACTKRFLAHRLHKLAARRSVGGGGERWGAYSFVACLRHLIIDDASLSRRSTVSTPNKDTSNILALIVFFPLITYKLFVYLIPLLFRLLWPPSVS